MTWQQAYRHCWLYPSPSALGLVIGCLSSRNRTSLCSNLHHLVTHRFVPELPLVCPLRPILIDFYLLNLYFAWFQTPRVCVLLSNSSPL